MATIGLAYLAWAKMLTEPTSSLPTYGTGMSLGRAIKADLTVTNATGQLYADNLLSEDVSEFSSGKIAVESDNITLPVQAAIYGATLVDDELGFGPADTAPYGGFGYYQILMINGVKKYRAFFYPKAKASLESESASTKAGGFTFGTAAIPLTIMAPAYGKWRYVKEFDTEAAAKAYIDAKLNVTAWYAINVQVNGASTGEGATPTGTTMVASAGSFALTITGTPTALYDNGVESKESIAAGVYTLSSVAAAHSIAVIF